MQKTRAFYILSNLLLGLLAVCSWIVLNSTNENLDLSVNADEWIQASDLAVTLDWAEKAFAAIVYLVAFIF